MFTHLPTALGKWHRRDGSRRSRLHHIGCRAPSKLGLGPPREAGIIGGLASRPPQERLLGREWAATRGRRFLSA